MAAGRQARSRESREKYQGRSRPLPPAFSRRLLPRTEPAEMGAWGTRPTRHPRPQREAGLSRAGVLVGGPRAEQSPSPLSGSPSHLRAHHAPSSSWGREDRTRLPHRLLPASCNPQEPVTFRAFLLGTYNKTSGDLSTRPCSLGV